MSLWMQGGSDQKKFGIRCIKEKKINLPNKWDGGDTFLRNVGSRKI
jgi:hypothetical protein